MSVNIKQYEFQLYEYLSQAVKLLSAQCESDSGLRHWRDEAAELQRRLLERRFHVAVVGEFNRGKTSFVNALLGKVLLPADYMPTTAAINRITYSDTPASYVLMKNGEKKQVELSDLHEYVTKLTTESAENAAQIQEAVLEYPTLICSSGVDLIDTPGLNDEASMNEVTLSGLKRADLAIVAVDAHLPFSMTERDFVIELLKIPQICQIIFVVTKIDMVRERDRERVVGYITERVKEQIGQRLTELGEEDEVLKKYHRIFDSLYVYPVSSLDALDAINTNDMDLYRESGFQRLNQELPQIILVNQNNNTTLTAARELEAILRRYSVLLAGKRAETEGNVRQVEEIAGAMMNACRECAAHALRGPAAALVPDCEPEIARIRTALDNSRKRIRIPLYNRVREALLPTVAEQYRVTAERLGKMTSSRVRQYNSRIAAPAGRELLSRAEAIMAPCEGLLPSVLPGLKRLADAFHVEEGTLAESFGWVASPLPEKSRLPKNRSISVYLDEVIAASVNNYRFRVEQSAARSLEQAGRGAEAEIGSFEQALRAQIAERKNRAMKKIEASEDSIARSDELLRHCSELREAFLRELESPS